MKIILVTDIFGTTPEVQELATTLSSEHIIIDPYEGCEHAFQSESDAYQYFSSNGGMNKYVQHLKLALESIASPSKIIGFSAGASAIWHLSGAPDFSGAQCGTGLTNNHTIHAALLFYGGQIRTATDISPSFPVHIVLPKVEQHFDIQYLAAQIITKDMVSIEHSDYLHGFMNQRSDNFNLDAYEYYKADILKFIQSD